MAKIVIIGDFTILAVADEGDQISKLESQGLEIPFSATFHSDGQMPEVQIFGGDTDVEHVRNALSPLAKVVEAVYPEKFKHPD